MVSLHSKQKDMGREEDNRALLEFYAPIEDQMQNIIKVIGVGGGGCNAVRNMYNEGIQGVSFAVCNTDSASLKNSPIPVKIQLGEGLGAGARPEVGRAEAESSIDMIEHLLEDQTKMVFVTATMGGGTGTGAAPVIARVAKEKGLLTIGVVTIPFYFEHRRKIIKALKGVDELRKNVDALLIVNNERLCDIYSDTNISLKNALAEADNVLKNAVKGISELITISSEGNINLDFRDVETTMRNGGGAIMAIGRSRGDHRVEHPIFVREMQEIDDFFDQLNPDVEVIWGTSTDDSLGEDAKVIILATDMNDEVEEKPKPCVTTDDEYYEELIKELYKPLRTEQPAEAPREEPKKEEPPFVVAPVVEPEPAQEPVADEQEEPKSVVSRMKSWLNRQLNMLAQDEV